MADAANPRLPLNERVPEGFFANAYRAENSYACDYNPSFHGSHASLSRGRERPCGRKPPAPLYSTDIRQEKQKRVGIFYEGAQA